MILKLQEGVFSGKVSACGMGFPGFDFWGQVKPKTLKLIAMASLLDALASEIKG